jgi:hypothetical protein
LEAALLGGGEKSRIISIFDSSALLENIYI